MEEKKLATAFNEWLRRYIDEPERFDREIEIVQAFNAAESRGEEPTYGENAASYLLKLLDEVK